MHPMSHEDQVDGDGADANPVVPTGKIMLVNGQLSTNSAVLAVLLLSLD